MPHVRTSVDDDGLAAQAGTLLISGQQPMVIPFGEGSLVVDVAGLMRLYPCLYVAALPHLALLKVIAGQGPVEALGELIHPLPADAAESLPDLCRPHQ